MIDFVLPDVGEGLAEAEIVTWHVVVGDLVGINDTLVEIETAKSLVELPSPAAGVVRAVHVAEGAIVEVGSVIISIDDGEPGALQPAARDLGSGHDADAQPPLVLVGTAPTEASPRRRHLSAGRVRGALGMPIDSAPSAKNRGRAKPPVRQLAKQLGVDLAGVHPSGDALITRADVHAAAERALSAASLAANARETRVALRGVRKATAAAMTRSAFTAPHVTEWLSVDVTSTMNMVSRLKQDPAWQGVRLTPLVFVARAMLLAVRRFPEINARWDEDAQEIVLQHYVNLGIAAATPRGLLVPNIKDSHALDLMGLAHAVDSLAQTARAGSTSPEQMSHGTITLTNIGALGVDAGTPILNPGEAAILAFGAVRAMPWVVDGQVVARQVTQLALSFDHRLVDGALGSGVLAEVGRLLRDPGETFLFV